MKTEYYIFVDGKKVYVPFEVWQAHNSFINHIQYKRRKKKTCRAGLKQMANCNGDCHLCRLWIPKGISIDTLIEYNDGQIADRNSEMLLRCEEIIADMARVDPDGELISRMIIGNCDQKTIAAVLGIPVSTYRDRLRRIGRMIGCE